MSTPPPWQGKYDYYEPLTKIVNLFHPNIIGLQGGEVLIQKKALDWIKEINGLYPNIKFGLVTNGNVNLDMVEEVERLFDNIVVSIVGFEPETYERIMGMDFYKTVNFCTALAKKKRVKLILKYLTTPLNIHTTNLFLEWAINLNPVVVLIEDANTMQYINANTSDKFWEKIFNRTAEKIKKVLRENRNRLAENNIEVRLSTAYL